MTEKTRSDFEGLSPKTPITRRDIAIIADVRPRTVHAWAQHDPEFPAKIGRTGRQLAYHRIDEVIDWLCRTGRLDCGANDSYMTMDQIAELHGVSVAAVKSWRRGGRFPRPEMRIGRVPLWSQTTVEAWERPKVGGKVTSPDTTRHQVAS